MKLMLGKMSNASVTLNIAILECRTEIFYYKRRKEENTIPLFQNSYHLTSKITIRAYLKFHQNPYIVFQLLLKNRSM